MDLNDVLVRCASKALDAGVAQVEQAFKDAGMWEDTVTVVGGNKHNTIH